MQKTFLARRWLAVLLALTMVVSMIPAVLAVNETITLNKNTLTLVEGDSETLTATVSDSSGAISGATVSWSSNNEAVATVDSDGKVTAQSQGSATITAVYTDNTYTTSVDCAVTVNAATQPTLDHIECTFTPGTLTAGGNSAALTLSTLTEVDSSGNRTPGSTAGVSFTINGNGTPSGIVEVSGQNITPRSAGSVTLDITVSYQGGTYNVQHTIVVNPASPPTLTLNRTTLELGSTGQTLTAEVSGTGVTGTGRYVWAPQNNPAIRMSGSGRSITLSAGPVSSDTTVTVTVTYTEGSITLTGECEVTVKANTSAGNIMTGITGQELPKKPDEGEAVNLTLKTGASDTLTFALTAQMENGSTSVINSNDGNATYTWSSENQRLITVVPNRGTNTATVTASGSDTGNGVIKVTATYTWNGRTVTTEGSFTIKVIGRVGTIRITPTGPFTMEPNGTQQLTATTDPAGQTIRWSVPSGDEKIVTVQSGASGSTATLYGHSPGKTSVTATIGEGDNTESQNVVVEVSGIILLDEDSNPLADDAVMTLTENQRKMVPLVSRFGNASGSRTVSWQSMDISVAEVSNGSVAGRGPGKTTITAFCGGYTASFTVEVTAGQSTIDLTSSTPLKTGDTLKFSSLASRIAAQVDGGLSHLTNLSVPTSQGTLYYQYTSEAQNGEGVAQSENYYAQSGNGRKVLSDVTFVPKPGYSGPVTISYSAVSSTGTVVSCRILHNAEQGASSNFSMSTPYNTALRFNSTEFEIACRAATGAQLDYVSFSLPPVRQGSLYTDYVNASNYGSVVTIRDQFSRSQLNDVWFVPAPGFEGDVTIYYTYKPAGNNAMPRSGQLRITVGRDTGVGIGGLSYDVVKGGVAHFDDADFGRYCREVLDDSQSLSFIRFDSLPSADQGVLYYDYRSATNTGSRASVGTTYYYGTRTPRIDRLSFAVAENYTGTIRIPFTGQTTNGTRFTGNVEVNVRSSSAGSGNISYSCQPGKSVKFDDTDFNRLCREQVNDRLRSIQFQGLPNTADGNLYYSGSAASVDQAYYNGTSYPRIDNLSFRATSRFTGSIDIPFVGTADSGETFYGIVTIDSSTGSGSSGNDLHYYTDSKTAAVFLRNDFDDLSQWLTDRDVSTVRFELPSASQGSLYQNYRSTSSQGTRITSSSTSIAAGSLGRVAFIPASDFVGTVTIDFTARATNNEEFTGTVEITVERPQADVTVRYATQVSPIHFRGSDFARGGATLRSIKFSTMPPTNSGHLYFQYNSPTQYDRQASTGSSYNLTGSSLIFDLTFVPKAGYSGTVTLPYVGTNSNGTTFDGEVIITVSPSYSSAYFNDMSGYSNEERAAVDYLYEIDVTSGVGGGRYGPTSSITRGDFALMVSKAFGLTGSSSGSQFSDVPSSAYYAQAVNQLYSLGIVSGVGNGRFGPNSQVTRQDALIMVRQAMRAVGWSAADGFASTLNGYTDGSSVSQYAQGAVSFALQMGYLPTRGGRIAPQENLNRIDMAQILHRVMTS